MDYFVYYTVKFQSKNVTDKKTGKGNFTEDDFCKTVKNMNLTDYFSQTKCEFFVDEFSKSEKRLGHLDHCKMHRIIYDHVQSILTFRYPELFKQQQFITDHYKTIFYDLVADAIAFELFCNGTESTFPCLFEKCGNRVCMCRYHDDNSNPRWQRPLYVPPKRNFFSL